MMMMMMIMIVEVNNPSIGNCLEPQPRLQGGGWVGWMM
jgi:hypothetical protein